tara:strand:- start:12677 stop:13033 length:357 start_codon:yes stop_codon:yes gene_type:complete
MVLETLTQRQQFFLDGAKDLVVNHSPFPNKAQTLLIILFTGIIDEDLERCKWAMDHGADVNLEVQEWAVTVMKTVGWDVTDLDAYAIELSTDAPEESPQTLPQCNETGPDSEASQEAI